MKTCEENALEEHYGAMWERSLEKFKDNNFEYDSLIGSREDNRYGLTLVARPSNDVKKEIMQTLREIEAVAPGQYYYPDSDLHLTILSIVSCYPGFSIDNINPNKYRSIIEKAITRTAPFRISFRGLTASPSCILIQGYPADGQLSELRNSLRDGFKHSNLQHSIDARYKLKTAHLTAIRFKRPLADPQNFVEIITDLRDKNFGQCVIGQLELVMNDWYHRKEKVTRLYDFSLDR